MVKEGKRRMGDGRLLYDVIKSGLMIKRSQNKNRFTLINYKTRWFELNRHSLSYFDIENYEVSHCQAEMQDIPPYHRGQS